MLHLPGMRVDERVLMKPMAGNRCAECGVQLKAETERCPLCGCDAAGKQTGDSAPTDIDRYQADLRRLREQLRKLRDGDAEAV